jgi:hypothetical protein
MSTQLSEGLVLHKATSTLETFDESTAWTALVELGVEDVPLNISGNMWVDGFDEVRSI